MKFTTLIALLLLLTTQSLRADCDADHPTQCTVKKFREELDKRLRAATKAETESKAPADAAAAVNTSEEKVGNQNRATTAPDPFAARLHNSYQDFITPLSFAINKVEESKDGRSLILRFNPIREKQIKVGLTVTAAKPTLYSKIKDAISDAERDDAAKKLDGTLKDLDDLTLAASFAFDNKQCDLKRYCFGRNPKTYRDALSEKLKDVLLKAAVLSDSKAAQRIEGELLRVLPAASGEGTPIALLDPETQVTVIGLVKQQTQADLDASNDAIEFLKKAGIDNLATLIDNQPQLSATGSYHQLGTLGGPDEVAASVEFQVGPKNLNNSANDLLNVLQQKPEDLQSDKLVFTASYKRSSHYKLDSLAGTGVTVTSFTPIDIARTSAWEGKVQWGRKLPPIMSKDQQPRIDLSGEFQRNGNGGIRTKNRFVATATLTVPVSEQMSVPVSVKYANKSEFLDVREKTSVHFGISYRLPWEPRP